MALIRLDKYLASALTVSRTDAKKMLREGTVLLNGVPCCNADTRIDTDCDFVTVKGKSLQYQEHIYLMMNKPSGIVSASADAREKTVVDLVPPELYRKGLFPAGRLDRDTTGFILLTDDGDFAHAILAPGRHVPKKYIVTLARMVTQQEAEDLLKGPFLDGKNRLPVETECLEESACRYSVVLHEGRYHQIKRMFSAQGNTVLSLHRIAMGGLLLDESLLPGECRPILEEERLKIAEKH